LSRIKTDRKAKEYLPQAIQKSTRTLKNNPREEYTLALLLQHPELKEKGRDISFDFFENSEYRLIFEKWITTNKTSNLKEWLDPVFHPTCDSLMAKIIPNSNIDEVYFDCFIGLKRTYLLNVLRKQEEILTLEAQSGILNADVEKQIEIGLKIKEELLSLEKMKSKIRQEKT
jgi:hypothetical protein